MAKKPTPEQLEPAPEVNWRRRHDELVGAVHATTAELHRIGQERAELVLARAAADPEATEKLAALHRRAAALREELTDNEAALAAVRLRLEEGARVWRDQVKAEARLGVELLGAQRRQLAAEIDATFGLREELFTRWRGRALATNTLAWQAGFVGETDALSDAADLACLRDAVHKVAPELAATLEVPGHTPGLATDHLAPLADAEHRRSHVVRERLAARARKEAEIAEDEAVLREEQATQLAARRGVLAA